MIEEYVMSIADTWAMVDYFLVIVRVCAVIYVVKCLTDDSLSIRLLGILFGTVFIGITLGEW